ncbi:MAG: hypothetical protein ACREJO_16765 [Phycisphaerales bacterium]
MQPAGQEPEPTPNTPSAPSIARRCAVCQTEITDRSLTRCPQCHSRYIRAEGKGAAGLSIEVIPTAPPPPPGDGPPRQSTRPPIPPDVLPTLGIIAGVLALCAALWMLATAAMWSLVPGLGIPVQPLTLVVAAVLLVLGGWGVCAYIRHTVGTRTQQYRAVWSCPHCRYTMMTMHTGRCPECGKLPDPLAWHNYRCPECRRDLHGYHASNCPECGADVREVTDGPNPEDGRHLPGHVPTPFDRSRVQSKAWSHPEEPAAPPQTPDSQSPHSPPMG